ncbi:MAG: hypothetical protein NT062_11895, partial [Proteobacteria bacterium]|nr:hypothetical protein [Pseudomonadota bacterium]
MRCILAAALTVWLGCGDAPASDIPPVPPDPPTSVADVIAKLTAIPGVTAVQAPTSTAGYAYVVVHFTQPVDHGDPSGPSFQMEASLLYRDGSAPLVVQTSGYWDYYLDNPV